MAKFRIKPGVDASTLRFGSLGYADWALASYRKFIVARRAGILPKTCRFQVCLPTPYAVTNVMVDRASHVAVATAYSRALKVEIDRLLSSIATHDLAVQWDVAQEIECLASGTDSFYPITLSDLASSLAALADHLPVEVEVGFHFCYGDYQHRHFIEPTDMGLMVNVLNEVWKVSGRPINFVHVPVPIDRSDDAYFEPLRMLNRHPETELYLGLIHFADGLAGTVARLATAERHIAGFGIGTECGFGRRAPETIPALLRLHAAAAGGNG